MASAFVGRSKSKLRHALDDLDEIGHDAHGRDGAAGTVWKRQSGAHAEK